MSDVRDLAYLRAQRATVERLLTRLDDDDDLERIGLEARLRELEQGIAALEELGVALELERQIQQRASATLLFGGEPVVETRAIEASFGADALRAFQKLVSTTAATRGGRRLGARGRIPDEQGSRLFITGTVQGSFGFELEEVVNESSGRPGLLRESVDEVGRLLEATRAGDKEFEEAVSESNPRVLSALAEFLGTLDAAGATLRLAAGERECNLDTRESAHAAAERARRARMTEAEQDVIGVLLGVLPVARRFELQVEDSGEVINGRLTDEIDDAEALTLLVKARCVARVWVVTLVRAGKEQRTYYLSGIERAAEEPEQA